MPTTQREAELLADRGVVAWRREALRLEHDAVRLAMVPLEEVDPDCVKHGGAPQTAHNNGRTSRQGASSHLSIGEPGADGRPAREQDRRAHPIDLRVAAIELVHRAAHGTILDEALLAEECLDL